MTAAEKILQKSLVGSKLNSEEWNGIQAGLRDRAFFSSQVENIRVLSEARRMCSEMADGKLSASEFRRDMRALLAKAGHPQGNGSVKDLYSTRRLDLIQETNVRQARGYAQYMESTADGALEAFPAQELIRVRERKMPRNWTQKWKDAGGRFFGGRMIALKTDPIWVAISRFGTPYPPFDFGSGMGVQDIDRDEAIRLGIIKADDPPQHIERDGFNDGLSARVNLPKGSPELDYMNENLTGQFLFNGREIVWRGEAIRNLRTSKTDDKLKLGKPPRKLLELVSLEDMPFVSQRGGSITSQWIRTHAEKHASPSGKGRNVKLNDGDYELIPSIWRNPDTVNADGERFLLSIDTLDGCTLHLGWDGGAKSTFTTFYKTKESADAFEAGTRP